MLKGFRGPKVDPINIGKVNDTIPVAQKSYIVARTLRKQIQGEIKLMFDAGIIVECKSFWCSPAVMVKKEDSSLRFCANYKKLNDGTFMDPFPMPSVEEIVDKLQGATIFTTLDLKAGHWQIPLDEESQPLTAFAFDGK